MVEIYRYGIDKVLLEFPGGTIEESEEPIKTARKDY
jgi:8-oxo-dGTP pyrophosphatase MutT (NUDIX family)